MTPPNMAPKAVTLETLHGLKSQVNDDALKNIIIMSVAFETSHWLRSLVKFVASANMALKSTP